MNEQPPTIERDHDDGPLYIVIDGALLAEIVGEDER